MSWLSGLLAGKIGQEYSCGPALRCARAEPAPAEEAITGVRAHAARTIATAGTERSDEPARGRRRLTLHSLGARPGPARGAARPTRRRARRSGGSGRVARPVEDRRASPLQQWSATVP